jgi:3-oxoacyl-[acyl-carrier protein] reductase
MRLASRTAIVTGAARGIGRAIAERFAREGAVVVVADLPKPLEAEADVLQNRGLNLVPVDITDFAAVEAMVSTVIDTFGAVDILVNNAGVIARGTIVDLTPEEWRRVLDVNLNGTFYCCKAVVPHMITCKSGVILNITSVAGKTGDITAAPVYGTSKGAVNAFTKSLARQLAEYGIRVNAIAPHAIETDMSAEWSAQKRAEVIQSIPLGRLGTVSDVAEAACFLVSDDSAFITGEVMDVNGGFLMD